MWRREGDAGGVTAKAAGQEASGIGRIERARVGAVEDVEAAAEADCCYPGLDWVRVRWPAGVAGEAGVRVAAQGYGSNEVVVRGR